MRRVTFSTPLPAGQHNAIVCFQRLRAREEEQTVLHVTPCKLTKRAALERVPLV
jgi:hypothetical protein